MEKDGVVFYDRTPEDGGDPVLFIKQKYGNAGTDRLATDADVQQFGAEHLRYLKYKAAASPLARFRDGVKQALVALDELPDPSPDATGPLFLGEQYEKARLALSGCARFADLIDPEYEPPEDSDEPGNPFEPSTDEPEKGNGNADEAKTETETTTATETEGTDPVSVPEQQA